MIDNVPEEKYQKDFAEAAKKLIDERCDAMITTIGKVFDDYNNIFTEKMNKFRMCR